MIDVEADGPCPGLYSMVSFGVVYMNDPSLTFYAETKPLETARPYIPEALAISGYTREQHEAFESANVAIDNFYAWLESLPGEGAFDVWSDNPAFDCQWMNYYFAYYNIKNPLGFSARRIGDVYAGLCRDLSKSGEWKRLRRTAHTHNALDDSIGNVEAMTSFLKTHQIDL